MRITADQFGAALSAASRLSSDEELRELAGSGTSRSYFVEFEDRVFPLKAILRLAYINEGVTWDGPQSSKAARLLRPHFRILHITENTEKARLERQRQSAERWARDAKFRTKVFDLYNATCIITGCAALDAIDAAHLLAVGNAGQDNPQNGLVLRADLHRLFDAQPPQMSINPNDLTVHFAAACLSHYAIYEGAGVVIPQGGPKANAFCAHWKSFANGRKLGA